MYDDNPQRHGQQMVPSADIPQRPTEPPPPPPASGLEKEDWKRCGRRWDLVPPTGELPHRPPPAAEDYGESRSSIRDWLKRRGPLCPLDLDPRVWDAVKAHYLPDADWSPAPNYHTEYRDARTAWLATKESMCTNCQD